MMFHLLKNYKDQNFHIYSSFYERYLRKPSSKTFLVGTRRKTSFLTGTAAVDSQHLNVKDTE